MASVRTVPVIALLLVVKLPMIAMSEFLPVCPGRDHRDLDGGVKDRRRSTPHPKGVNGSGRRLGATLLLCEECELGSQGKKVADSRCG